MADDAHTSLALMRLVAACRRRIKRFHVRINQLKLRKKDILLAIKNDRPAADQTPDRNDI